MTSEITKSLPGCRCTRLHLRPRLHPRTTARLQAFNGRREPPLANNEMEWQEEGVVETCWRAEAEPRGLAAGVVIGVESRGSSSRRPPVLQMGNFGVDLGFRWASGGISDCGERQFGPISACEKRARGKSKFGRKKFDRVTFFRDPPGKTKSREFRKIPARNVNTA
jgi:hypothetical protein